MLIFKEASVHMYIMCIYVYTYVYIYLCIYIYTHTIHICILCIDSAVKLLSCVQIFATPWTVAYQASPSMGFSQQEYWSGLPFPSPGDLPNPRVEPRSPALQADALTSESPGKPLNSIYMH